MLFEIKIAKGRPGGPIIVGTNSAGFADFTGEVTEVNLERERIKASVIIFGRATPVELEFNQVIKV